MVALGAIGWVVAGCNGSTTELEEPAALLSVSPQAGAVDVSATAPVQIVFDHAMAAGVEAFAALHEGDVTGPEVPGVWTLSADRTTMTFAPDGALMAATTYVIHVGGAMMDDHGNAADLERHGAGMGGQWATGSMMMGPGGQGGGTHMGDGWRHPTNGSYGMVFAFTTAP